ncbi:MAG: response regulator, partial [Methanomassiliicoccales archaeon]
MLIDDEPDLLDLARHFLELDRDISVDTAISADSAARMIESREYDVIVSDYQMPGKDGIQFLMEMRAKDNSIPFIL